MISFRRHIKNRMVLMIFNRKPLRENYISAMIFCVSNDTCGLIAQLVRAHA